MTRIAGALLLLTGGLYSLHPETPAAPYTVQPVKHRHSPQRVSRSMLRLPLEASTPDTAKARTPGHRPDPLPVRSPRSADLRAAAAPWQQLADCESGGNWSANTGNGFYGGLQFTLSTWASFGGHGLPSDAAPTEQVRVAERVLAAQGWGAWPVCSARVGLR